MTKFKSTSEQEVHFSKQKNEHIIWSGKPLPVRMQRSKFFLHFYLAFMPALISVILLIAISVELEPEFTGISKISWLFLLFAFCMMTIFFTLGFNTKNSLIKWYYNPFMEYISWMINLYPHYLYDVEENSYQKIQEAIHSIEDLNNSRFRA